MRNAKMGRFQIMAICTALILLSCKSVFSDTYYVALDNPTPSAPYTSWETAANDIQTAVNEASDGDTVLVSDGVYYLKKEISITNAIILSSVHGASSTIIDGTNSKEGPYNEGGRCINLHNSMCELSGFTVRNADHHQTNQSGGGIGCSGKNPLISNCIIHDNYSRHMGGGLANGTVINSIFYNNKSSEYGGAAQGSTLINCLFYNNIAVKGGAASSSHLINCTITGNRATSNGGGVYYSKVVNSIVYYNLCDGTGGQPDIEESELTFSCSPSLIAGVNGNIKKAPLFVSQENHDYHLAEDSPCINAGNDNEVSIFIDLDGNPRMTDNSSVDMGAYEYTPYDAMLASSVPYIKKSCFLGTSPASDTFYIWNTGTSKIDYQIKCDASWLSISPTTGTNSGEKDTIALVYRTKSLTVGTYTGRVSIVSSKVENSPLTINVIVRIYPLNVYVSATTGSDENSGLDWHHAKASITAAMNELNNSGTVYVSNGTYKVSSEIKVKKEISIVGFNGPESTILDAGGSRRCFNLGKTKCIISGLTISNGSAYNGGGIYCSNSNPIVTHCIIRNNTAKSGGGGVLGGRLLNCTVYSNNTTFGEGGGLYESIASNCTIRANNATHGGGGMYHGTAYNCRIVNNTTSHGPFGRGGGLYGVTAINCLIKGNRAGSDAGSRSGGGAYGGTCNSCTIIDNSADYAGGIYKGTVNNSIIYYNNAQAKKDTYETTAFHSCSSELTQGVDGNITNAPDFIDMDLEDYHLRDESPCIDAGDKTLNTASEDLDHRDRMAGKNIDMGAYEYALDPISIHQSNDGRITLHFDRISPKRTFTILWAPDLSTEFIPIQQNIADPVTSFTDKTHPIGKRGFYKIIRGYTK